MLIDSIKEACDTLEKVVEDYVNDDWDKNQATDALVYLRENAFDKIDIADEIESMDNAVTAIKKELRLEL